MVLLRVAIFQEISASGMEKIRDQVDLNVHAISDLNKRGVQQTDDSAKYAYAADSQAPDANYRMFSIAKR